MAEKRRVLAEALESWPQDPSQALAHSKLAVKMGRTAVWEFMLRVMEGLAEEWVRVSL